MYSSYGSYSSGDAMTVLIFTLLITVGLSVLMIIAQWKLFTKAGEPGWKSIIPFYGGYTFYRLTWTPAVFFVTIAISFLSMLFTRVPAVTVILGIAAIIISIISFVYTAHAYGKYGGFVAGMIFLPFIFFPILAFGDSQYIGPKGEPAYGYSPSGDADTPSAVDAGESVAAAPKASSRKGLIWIAAAILGGIALLVIGCRLLLAFSEYRPRGTSFVGMENFQRLFSDPRAMQAVGTTLATRLVDLALAVGLGFAGAAAGRGKARPFIAGLGLALAIVPMYVWEFALLSTRAVSVMDGGLALALIHALPWAGLSMFAGALLAPKWPSSPVGAALAAPALMLLSGVSSVSMPMIFASRNLDFMTMEYGLMRYQVGLGAGIEVIRGLVTLPLAVGGIFLLAGLLRKHGCEHSLEAQGSALPATLLAGLIPLVVGVVLLATGDGSALADSYFAQAVGTSVSELFLTLLVGFGFYFGLYCLVGRFDQKSGLPLGLTFTMALALGALSIVGYLLPQLLRLLDTIVPVIVSGVLNPFALTFAFVLALARPAKVSSRLLLALAAAAFAAGCCATGWTSSILYLMRIQDLGLLMRRSVAAFSGQGGFAAIIGVLLLFCGVASALAGLFSVKGTQSE